MRDEKSILPVSHMIHGAYGIEDVVLSMPAIVGADGVETDIPIKLSGEEALKLKESADALKDILASLLSMSLKFGKIADVDTIKNFAALNGKNVTVQDAILIKQVQKAMKGDTKGWSVRGCYELADYVIFHYFICGTCTEHRAGHKG